MFANGALLLAPAVLWPEDFRQERFGGCGSAMLSAPVPRLELLGPTVEKWICDVQDMNVIARRVAGYGSAGVGNTAYGRMDTATVYWQRSFTYHDRDVSIVRLAHGWRVGMDMREPEAGSLIEAFESLSGRHVSDDDLRFLLTLMAFDLDASASII